MKRTVLRFIPGNWKILLSRDMQEFKLYNDLAEIARKSSQPVDLRKICNALIGLSEEHATIVFLLIFHHELVENNGIRFRPIPYGGTVVSGGKGVMYNMTSLPPFLQRIIAQYISKIS